VNRGKEICRRKMKKLSKANLAGRGKVSRLAG